MKNIKLSRGLVTLVDDDWYEALNRFKWHTKAKANAELIVRAVNNHEMLIEALQQSIDRLRKLEQPVIGLELVIAKASSNGTR